MTEPLLRTDALGTLGARLRARRATVAVVGLGYVGLPLLAGVRDAGFAGIGYDVDREKVEALRNGRSPIVDLSDAALRGMETTFTDDDRVLAQADVVVICVPTPLADGMPDLSMVRAAGETVAANLRPGTLVVLESTTYPGTTEELLAPILTSRGLIAGTDLAVAYSPERIDPGRSSTHLRETPKVVAGLTPRCLELAVMFYEAIVDTVVPTSSPREAEMAKLIENTYRQVNIALVNELAIVANDLGVDIWESLRVAATKPFGYQAFWPGPGVGGHCIAIDPTYLSWRAGQQLGYRPGFIEHANEVNHRMPSYVALRVVEALNTAGKPAKGSRILGVGVAFKPGVDDLRESPSIAVLERLAERGALVDFHDPLAPRATIAGQERRSIDLGPGVAASYDAVVILTPHEVIDVKSLIHDAPLVFDARGVVAPEAPNVIRL